jgi:hypothetical protein
MAFEEDFVVAKDFECFSVFGDFPDLAVISHSPNKLPNNQS